MILFPNANAGPVWNVLRSNMKVALRTLLLLILIPTDAAVAQPPWRRLAAAPGGVPGETEDPARRVIALAVDPLRGGFVYAGNNYGLFRLAVGSGDWVPTPISSLVYTITIAPRNPSAIYVTALGAISPLRGLRYRTLFRSTDAGETWTAALNSITSIVVDPSEPTTVYAGASPEFVWYATGVYRSEDGGDHWSSPAGDFGCGVLAINPVNPAILYAANYGSIFESMDAGATWSTVHTGDYVYAIAVDPLFPATVYAGSATGTFPSTHGLLRSTDAGATWSLLSVPSYGFGPVVVDPLSGTLLVATDSGVVRSDDRGEHWTAFSDGLTGFPVSSLAVGPRSTFYAGTQNGVFAVSVLSRATSRHTPAPPVPIR